MHRARHLHELSLKLEREKTFFGVLRTGRTLQQILSQYLFSFMEKHLTVFSSQSLRQRKQNPYEQHKEVKSKPEMWFSWTVVVRFPALVAKGP